MNKKPLQIWQSFTDTAAFLQKKYRELKVHPHKPAPVQKSYPLGRVPDIRVLPYKEKKKI